MPTVNDFKDRNGAWVKQFNACGVRHETYAAVAFMSMVTRCSPKRQAYRSSHAGCVNKFADFQEFASWFTAQPGYHAPGGGLVDKDLLVPGNRTYSPETCVVVPKEVNNFVSSRKAGGSGRLGVHERRGRFNAATSSAGQTEFIGSFDSAEDADLAYRIAKCQLAADLAQQHEPYLCGRARAALRNYPARLGCAGMEMPAAHAYHKNFRRKEYRLPEAAKTEPE